MYQTIIKLVNFYQQMMSKLWGYFQMNRQKNFCNEIKDREVFIQNAIMSRSINDGIVKL